MAEAHGGVIDCEEECWAIIEADSPDEAMKKYAETQTEVIFYTNWNCWLWRARKLWAVLS